MPREQQYNLDDLFSGGLPESLGGRNFISGNTPSFQSTFSDGVGAGVLADGDLVSNIQQRAGTIWNGKSSFSNTEAGYRLGVDESDGLLKFYIGDSTSYLNWTGTSLDIAGALTATTIDIGGADATSFHVDIDGNMWLGAATFASAPFKVSNAGAATASSMTITGGAISSTPISSIPNDTSTDISLLEKTHTMVFSVTDSNTIAWTSGTITLSNGRTFSISSGNTGNMAALTYIYLDPAVSSTALQTTTTAATAMGANKILIGTAQNHSVTAHFIPYGPGQPLIDGSNIGALSIVAGNIAASTITAGKMNVSQLSAIAADIGSITAGTIVLSASGHIRSGQTAFNTGTGFFLGVESSTPKFSIGNSSGNRLTWDGTSLVVVSNLAKGGVTTRAGDAASGTQNIAHGLSTTPSLVRIHALKIADNGTSGEMAISDGSYDGTNTNCIFLYQLYGASVDSTMGSSTTKGIIIYDAADGASKQEATVSLDSTNIVLTWTKTGSPTADNIQIKWEIVNA